MWQRTDGEQSNKQEKEKACGKIFPAVFGKLEFFLLIRILISASARVGWKAGIIGKEGIVQRG